MLIAAEHQKADAPALNPVASHPRLFAVACMIIVLAAVLVRVYRLDAQSVWWDDYNSIAYLDAPTLSAYLSTVGEMNDMHVPLYFILQYGWARCAGTSPETIRLLSILFGVLTLPVIFLLGRDLLGRRAGLIAALCFALSPEHVFHDQAIRPYSLMVLMAGVSLLGFERAVRGRRARWWAVNVTANLLLVETHYYGVLLLFTEGCFLLLFARGNLRRLLAWTAIHGMMLVALTVFVNGAVNVVRGWRNDLCQAPSVAQYVYDLAGDDAVGLNQELLPAGETWAFIPARAAATLSQLRPGFDYALLLAFLAALGWAVWRIADWAQGASARASRSGSRSQFETMVLLVLVAALPVTVLAVVSHVWRPTIFPRYTMYSSLALYVFLGGAIASVPDAAVRKGAVAALIGLYGYQLSWLLPAATRTQWVEAAQYIQTNASPNDVILIAGESGIAFSPTSLYLFNNPDNDHAVLPADSRAIACEAAACFARSSDAQPKPCVWLLIQRRYAGGPLAEVEACLTSQGLNYAYREFPAMRRISLYKVADAAANATPPAGCSGLCREMCYALACFAIEQNRRGDYIGVEAALRSLSRVKPFPPGPSDAPGGEAARQYPVHALVLDPAREDYPRAVESFRKVLEGMRHSMRGDRSAAREAYQQAVAVDPAFAVAHFLVAVDLLEQGDTPGFLRSMHEAFKVDADFSSVLKPLITAAFETHDYDSAWRELDRLTREGVSLPGIIRERLEQDSGRHGDSSGGTR